VPHNKISSLYSALGTALRLIHSPKDYFNFKNTQCWISSSYSWA